MPTFNDGAESGNHLPCAWEPTLLSDALRLETSMVLRAAGGASISPRADSSECATNSIQCPIEQSAPNHRYRTGSILCSGLSRSQSCLKNPAHLSHFFTERTVSADRHLSNRPRPHRRPRSRSLNVIGNSARFLCPKKSRTRTTMRTRTIGGGA